MDQRTTGIIATLAAVLLCGLPGLCLCIFSGVTAIGVMPFTYTDFNNSTVTGVVPASYGYGGLCLSILLILIPVVVGLLLLRRRPPANPV
jgi:hypothetical protein